MQCTFARVSSGRCAPFLLSIHLLLSPAIAGAGETRGTGSPPAMTPTSAATVVNVSWLDVVRLVDQHPRLSAGKLEIDAARAGVNAAGAVPNPTLEATGGEGFERAGNGSRGEWNLTLSMPLGWIAQRRSKIDAARAGVDVAVAETESLRRDALLQLRTLFWSLADQQSAVAALDALQAQTSALVRTVKRRVEKGEARPVEATRVEIELEKVANELETARISLSSRQAELARWLTVPDGATIAVSAELDALPAAMDRATALARARATHPALAAVRAKTRTLEAEVSTQKMARVPAFSISGFATSELDRQAYGVGLNVDLPIWNWNSAGIAQAEARLSAARKQAASAALEIESEVIDAQAACRSSVATATRQKDKVVPLSATAASTMERTYELGEASLLEVIDARRTLLDSRRLYLSALAQAHVDCSRLDALAGEEG